MKITESQAEKYGGMILSIFSLILYFLIIPTQISNVENVLVSPQSFPKALAIVLLILSLCLFASGIKKNKKDDQKIYSISFSEIKLVLITLGIVAAYILVVKYLGYLITTIIALGILMFIYGQRKRKTILIVSIMVPILIEVFFTKLMKIHLP